MLMRGTEGEPAADARRLQKLDVFSPDGLRPELSLPGQEGVVTRAPALPPGNDASTTARTSRRSSAVPCPRRRRWRPRSRVFCARSRRSSPTEAPTQNVVAR